MTDQNQVEQDAVAQAAADAAQAKADKAQQAAEAKAEAAAKKAAEKQAAAEAKAAEAAQKAEQKSLEAAAKLEAKALADAAAAEEKAAKEQAAIEAKAASMQAKIDADALKEAEKSAKLQAAADAKAAKMAAAQAIKDEKKIIDDERKANVEAFFARRKEINAQFGRRPAFTHIVVTGAGLSFPQATSARGKIYAAIIEMQAAAGEGVPLSVVDIQATCGHLIYGENTRPYLSKLEECGHVIFETVSE